MALDHLLSKLEGFSEFSRKYRATHSGVCLGNHQLIPIFDAVENGLRRFVLAYGTGAGKTAVPMEILRHLSAKGKDTRTLVLAPKQTLGENWNPAKLADHGLDIPYHSIRSVSSSKIPSHARFVTVNYDKLLETHAYLDPMLSFAAVADMVIVDEFHNVKTRNGKVSQAYQRIINASKDARLILLSASPCPDSLKDAGMMLFALDPLRYRHYGGGSECVTFQVKEDPEALWEMREKGNIRFFEFEDVKRFHHLPEFTLYEPLKVEMTEEFVLHYLKEYQEGFDFGKLHKLETVAIQAMIQSPDTLSFFSEKIQEGYCLNFFSHLTAGSLPQEEGLFKKLEDVLRNAGAGQVRFITGRTPQATRDKIQKEMGSGTIDALINQWDCTSEGFSEAAGDRPVLIIPLRSPFSPGRYIQMIGRSYRPGQRAPVGYREIHAESGQLRELIECLVRERAEVNGIKIKSTWAPTLFHEDARSIRTSKELQIDLLFNERSYGLFCPDGDTMDVGDDTVIGKTATILSQDRILDFSNRENSEFGGGVRQVTRFVGKPYDYGLGSKDNAEPLGADYDRADILLYAPGKVNWALAEAVEKIKDAEGNKGVSWRIADLGCCSSAVFSQARMVYQAIERSVPDHIVSVDGIPGFVRSAHRFLEAGGWISTVSQLKIAGKTPEDMEGIASYIRGKPFMDDLEFRAANFAKEEFGKEYDAVIASQCLQYNDQHGNRDIEKIITRINGALRTGGHCIIAMTGNSRKDSFTRPQDIAGTLDILEKYGFEIRTCSHLSGMANGREVVRPFHYIHAVKSEDVYDLHPVSSTTIVVYPNRFEYLSGGSKQKYYRRNNGRKPHGKQELPTTYVGEDGRPVVF